MECEQSDTAHIQWRWDKTSGKKKTGGSSSHNEENGEKLRKG
jgi:hypothetical protein